MVIVNALYLFVSGILLGAGVGGHALRLVNLYEDPKALEKSRVFIAWSAVFIYGLGALLTFFGCPAGLYIAIVFPIVGITAVTITGYKIDTFQIVLGLFQILAAVVSVYILYVT
jgi:hypothetical protein